MRLIIPVLVCAFLVGLFAAISGLPDRQWSVAGATVLVSIAAAALGALIGFLIAVPPEQAEDAEGKPIGSDRRKMRISVLSDWLVGAAFALALTNGDKLLNALLHTSEWVTQGSIGSPTSAERVAQTAVISAIVFWLPLGFAVGWWQTGTNGYRLLGLSGQKKSGGTPQVGPQR